MDGGKVGASLSESSVYERIHALVSQVPYGKVTTYGHIAAMEGRCTARMVGYAMASLPMNTDVPWQRVINRQGKISARTSGHGSGLQRQLLEDEGVSFDLGGRVDFREDGWEGPEEEWLAFHGFYSVAAPFVIDPADGD